MLKATENRELATDNFNIVLRNYLKIAWRNVLREKGYAFINVFGLAVGIAFCVLIFLFVRNELTYDNFHKNGDRIFRVQDATIHSDGSVSVGGSTGPIVLGPALKSDVPGIEQYIRFQQEDHFVRARDAQGEAVKEEVLFADPAVLKVFTFPLKRGNPTTALSNPDDVVITVSMARKYFGNENPVGKILQIRLDQKFENFVVSGVAKDVPGNSTIQFGILLPFDRLLIYNDGFRKNTDSWHFYSPQTYVELNRNTTAKQVESKLPAFYKKYHEDNIVRKRKEGHYNNTLVQSYDLKPIRDIHLTSDSKPAYSYILSAIALAVLLIACINFMTLSIGRSARRAREVGIRKVVGAERKQIMAQFWGESFLLTVIALILGLLLAESFLPVFNNLTGKSLVIGNVFSWAIGFFLVGLVVITSFVAGSYPALVLSGFQPVETLAKRLHLGKSNNFTKSLVVIQFAVTVFLITSTLIMARQLYYTHSMNLGFNKNQVVVIPTSGLDAGRIAKRFRTDLAQQPNVLNVTASGNTLGQTGTMGTSFMYKGKQVVISVFRIDTHYLDFLGLNLIAGRNFRPDQPTDSTHSVIVDEALVRAFGFKNPIGQRIPYPWASPKDQPMIIGVVKDYHFQSLYDKVGPLVLTLDPGWNYEQILVRIRPGNIPKTLGLLKKTWQTSVRDVPFTYHFLDEQMQAYYANDYRWSQIIRYASIFAILISCLGLLGLTALTVTRRTKEIGIRKVLGANVSNIVMLISKEFAVLVVVGFALASPVAYIAMRRWLEDFAYRVPLSVWMFLAAGLMALVVALITVGYHSVRSAMTNPVESLRNE